jgi:glycosyltransferase involved in cell wall biosynthesis
VNLRNDAESEITPNTIESPQIETWVGLLGRRDMPTDGVEDYCTFLGKALVRHGVELRQVRVPWTQQGWIATIRRLSRESAAWRGKWVLLQYTALGWSRRGFPFGALAVLAVVIRGGARVAVVFHESDHQTGSGLLQGIRGWCQDWVIRRLHSGARKAIFTVPLEAIAWLPSRQSKAAFISIGANIPECTRRRATPALTVSEKSVIVFGVTCSPDAAAREVNEISTVMVEVRKKIDGLRLVVMGRGSVEAQEHFLTALRGHDVELVVRGILPAEEIAHELESAHALLFVRGGITPRHGSVMAGIASGIPIVGYRDESIGGPLEQAGVAWSPWHDQESLILTLVGVLRDPGRWMELHDRNLEVQKKHLSWTRIAEQFEAVLAK